MASVSVTEPASIGDSDRETLQAEPARSTRSLPGWRVGRHSTPVLPAVLGRWGVYEFVAPHVRHLVADHLGVDVEELVPEVSLRDDLAADSLDLVELALSLEERFGIGVPEHILDQVRSYGALVETTVDLIRSRRAAESRSAAEPAHFVARIVPAEVSDGILERGGWLTPYTVETIAEDALRAGRGARLEVTVAASTEDAGLSRARDDFACLGQRGVLVTVWREGH
jgi:acyl carrier protein